MATVEINDLPQQRDFFDSARNQIAHFGHDLVDGPAAFRSTRLRHNAEGAVHIASLHDRDKRRRLARPQLLVANGRLRTGFPLDINDRKPQIIHAIFNWTLSVERLLAIYRSWAFGVF